MNESSPTATGGQVIPRPGPSASDDIFREHYLYGSIYFVTLHLICAKSLLSMPRVPCSTSGLCYKSQVGVPVQMPAKKLSLFKLIHFLWPPRIASSSHPAQPYNLNYKFLKLGSFKCSMQKEILYTSTSYLAGKKLHKFPLFSF